jgi:DNA helicase HerA-like ATPase
VTDISARYGLVTKESVGAIQRRLLVLENEGGAKLFGEPALDLADLMTVDPDGSGRISILAGERLMNSPRLYATFLLWLLSELFETLPEVGDPEKPKLVFFFDEAHLLFNDAPKALIAKVEQVARLIRSKGVGVYFITQNPADVPENILGQLGNRVQHALRAFTAKDQKGLKLAAETYRPNPDFNISDAIRDVGTGEAVTSFLEAKGVPGIAQRTLIRPPSSQVGPIAEAARAAVMSASPMRGKYDTPIDRESAWEKLRARAGAAAEEAARAETAATEAREFERARRYDGKVEAEAKPRRSSSSRSDSVTEVFAKSFARQLGSKSGQAMIRGVLGSLFGKR